MNLSVASLGPMDRLAPRESLAPKSAVQTRRCALPAALEQHRRSWVQSMRQCAHSGTFFDSYQLCGKAIWRLSVGVRVRHVTMLQPSWTVQQCQRRISLHALVRLKGASPQRVSASVVGCSVIASGVVGVCAAQCHAGVALSLVAFVAQSGRHGKKESWWQATVRLQQL